MNLNILQENMKRFGTKNLKEQADAEVPADMPAQVDPDDKESGEKVQAEKTYSFLGVDKKDSNGADIKRAPYSINIKYITYPVKGADGKVLNMGGKLLVDDKLLFTVFSKGTIGQWFKQNTPAPLKGLGADRIYKYIIGMLMTEARMDASRLKAGFAKNGIKLKPIPGPLDVYKSEPNEYYSYS